ncbi:DUF1810 domain-containing protein [Ferruginibacter paludis]|uniref:DUF1810 domain-containing protein n=1 Tax=Ferruginibacter paludis TaxID=1310417 RepID=UPI0025B307F5|nr:DUF1810 domain-containing protein [Ferruginibacter paludis]MDN3655482.1 DUF1810 domain-containing protein [Ferruginibacter paludis]
MEDTNNFKHADKFVLSRFIRAQAPVYATVLKELKEAKKVSHWMWFIFPQVAGLGSSDTSVFYSIKSLEEAAAYLAHPVLGKRLIECSTILSAIKNKTAYHIFSSPDDHKLRSCMTLFSLLPNAPDVFDQVLGIYFKGQKDQLTVGIVQRMKD